MGKAALTTEYILEKVAPYFNRHGYFATSLSDLTNITGLTKGAIYGNFESKEDLALQSFRYNIRQLLSKINKAIEPHKNAVDKLLAITTFYRDYINFSEQLGGCPVLKVGMDSVDNNPALKEKVKEVTMRLKDSLQNIIENGQKAGEIDQEVDALKKSNIIYGSIEGAMFLATILNDKRALHDNIDHLEEIICNMRIK